VRAFESVQRQREQQLSDAAMLADLPTLKPQMTTEHRQRFRMLPRHGGNCRERPLHSSMPTANRAFHVTKSGWSPEGGARPETVRRTGEEHLGGMTMDGL